MDGARIHGKFMNMKYCQFGVDEKGIKTFQEIITEDRRDKIFISETT